MLQLAGDLISITVTASGDGSSQTMQHLTFALSHGPV